MKRTGIAVALLAMASSVAHAQGALGPQGTLYLTTGSAVQMVQGLNINSFAVTPGQGVLAVPGFLSTWNYAYNTQQGLSEQYSLSGAPLGSTTMPGVQYTSGGIDGATDGIYNYFVETPDAYLGKRDVDWTSVTSLPYSYGGFLPRWSFGLTYDPFTSTFWSISRNCYFSQPGEFCDGNGQRFLTQNRSDGTVLQYDIGFASWLAMDYTDGTFWVGGGNTLRNYSNTGAFIGAAQYNATLGVSGEFNIGTVVPEPSTYALMATGLIAIAVATQRRRRA